MVLISSVAHANPRPESKPEDVYYKPYIPPSVELPPRLPTIGYPPDPYEVRHGPEYPPQPYEPPAYIKAPKLKQNCTVKDEVLRAEICTPSFETKCQEESISVKKITTRDYCFDLAKTECVETEETIANEICVYEYMSKDEDATATTVKVNFEKDCNTQMVTVCDPSFDKLYTSSYRNGYHAYNGYGAYCKEVQQTTCYNTPKVNGLSVQPLRMTDYS